MAATREIRAQPGPQTDFLSSSADIVIYGGAAGGGKTYGLLLDPLRYINVKGFGFVIFRRESPQIRNEGGLWDTSQELYPAIGGRPKVGDLSWHFPAGTKGSFRHLQHEKTKLNWQGAQVPYVGFDELTHFSDTQFWYMLSRNRSACGVPPCIRATTNPAPGWVKVLLAPWVDRGFPGRARSGEIRYFTRQQGQIVWVGPEWRDKRGRPAKSITFVRSTVYDNKKLLDVNPEYLTNLESLPDVDRLRLLEGDWDVFEGAFFSEWSDAAHTVLAPQPDEIPGHWRAVGGFDWGYGKPCCFLLAFIDDAGRVLVVDELYQAGLENEEQALKIAALLHKWRRQPADVLIAADPSMWTPKKIGKLARADVEDFWAKGLRFVQAENSRRPGWSQVRTFLHVPGRLQIAKGNCSNLIRLMPLSLYATVGDLEDMDTDQEDHAQDALRYLLNTRPKPTIALPPPPSAPVNIMLDPATGEFIEIKPPKRLPHALTSDPDPDY